MVHIIDKGNVCTLYVLLWYESDMKMILGIARFMMCKNMNIPLIELVK